MAKNAGSIRSRPRANDARVAEYIVAFSAEVDDATRWAFVAGDSRLVGAQTVFMFDYASSVLARSDKPEGEGVGVRESQCPIGGLL